MSQRRPRTSPLKDPQGVVMYGAITKSTLMYTRILNMLRNTEHCTLAGSEVTK